jgi:hypothetical protein
MIPLGGAVPPAGRDELVESLTRGLGGVFELPAGRPAVVAVGERFPALDQLNFDVSHARIRPEFRPRQPGGTSQATLSTAQFHIKGKRVAVERSNLDFEITGRDVHFEIKQEETELFLDPVDAKDGKFASRIARRDLEELLLTAGQDEVGKHGLKLEQVEVDLRDQSTRSVQAEVRVTASTEMGFATLKAVVRANGQLVIDEALNLVLKGLTFEGEGLAGRMAAGLAQRFLQEWDGWSFPLSSLSLGRLRLRDVHLACRDGLQIQAQLGS